MNVEVGKLLLAQPFMLDPNFKRSVVLLCEHDSAKGSLGFILNKPLNMQILELVGDFPDIEADVFYGGPVATDTLHYIHDKGDLLQDSIEIHKGIYWGGDYTRLKFLIENKLILASNIKFFVGYSGWSEEQLDAELEIGSWVVADMDFNYLFHKEEGKLWKKVMENKGSSYGVIGQISESHRLN
ncbi:YqgE/AlgH family protein [Portibacter marinus]|uniref:YqgE/AlgH family protein n=1 Tax=Portibacter marinus TaxID=2898660 RepID=UPI001F15BC91|nr:YqgE/AlgH family protein [Portibacter marinus]